MKKFIFVLYAEINSHRLGESIIVVSVEGCFAVNAVSRRYCPLDVYQHSQ